MPNLGYIYSDWHAINFINWVVFTNFHIVCWATPATQRTRRTHARERREDLPTADFTHCLVFFCYVLMKISWDFMIFYGDSCGFSQWNLGIDPLELQRHGKWWKIAMANWVNHLQNRHLPMAMLTTRPGKARFQMVLDLYLIMRNLKQNLDFDFHPQAWWYQAAKTC